MKKHFVVKASRSISSPRRKKVYATGGLDTGVNHMIVTVSSGINADGFSVEIFDPTGKSIFKERYSFGYNASYDRKFARWAENDVANARKYGWANTPSLKPFVGDIIDDLCAKYGINKESIEYQAGKNVFKGNNVSDESVRQFIDDYVYGSSKPKKRFKVSASCDSKKKSNVKASEGSQYEEIVSKSVSDTDGFLTDYTLYYDQVNDTYICILGDKELYNPENCEPDFECDTYDEAVEWYNDYNNDEFIEGSTVVAADEGDEFDLPQVSQKFSSKKTAVNGRQGKLPAIFKLISFKKGTINLDYGGGTEDAQAVADAYFADKDVTNLIYDVYNQTAQHNREVVKQIRSNGGADTSTLSNVLNVIAEPESRLNVLKNIKNLLKPSGTLYITVYEGAKANRGSGKQTGEDQYQTNMALADYLEEVQQVFPGAKRKGKMIIAPNGGSGNVSSATAINASMEGIDIADVFNAAADTLNPEVGDVGTIAGPSPLIDDEHFSIIQYDVGIIYVSILNGAIVSMDGDTGEVLDSSNSIPEFCKYVERINASAMQMMDEAEGRYSANASTNIRAAGEPPIDPPDYDEPEEVDPNAEEVEIPFDCDIIMNEDGGWDYADESYDWAAGPGSNGDWYSEEHNVFLGDKVSMVEYIDELLMTRLPDTPGNYHISGTAVLVFDVSGVSKYSDYQGKDEDGDPIIDESFDTDYADADFNIQQSTINDFEYTQQ